MTDRGARQGQVMSSVEDPFDTSRENLSRVLDELMSHDSASLASIPQASREGDVALMRSLTRGVALCDEAKRLSQQPRQERFHRAIADLPALHQHCFLLSQDAGLSLEAIASLLDISVRAVLRAIHLAYNELLRVDDETDP
jgi:DNA-directed RNA polymerase specialized sigma24 family protein